MWKRHDGALPGACKRITSLELDKLYSNSLYGHPSSSAVNHCFCWQRSRIATHCGWYMWCCKCILGVQQKYALRGPFHQGPNPFPLSSDVCSTWYRAHTIVPWSVGVIEPISIFPKKPIYNQYSVTGPLSRIWPPLPRLLGFPFCVCLKTLTSWAIRCSLLHGILQTPICVGWMRRSSCHRKPSPSF